MIMPLNSNKGEHSRGVGSASDVPTGACTHAQPVCPAPRYERRGSTAAHAHGRPAALQHLPQHAQHRRQASRRRVGACHGATWPPGPCRSEPLVAVAAPLALNQSAPTPAIRLTWPSAAAGRPPHRTAGSSNRMYCYYETTTSLSPATAGIRACMARMHAGTRHRNPVPMTLLPDAIASSGRRRLRAVALHMHDGLR